MYSPQELRTDTGVKDAWIDPTLRQGLLGIAVQHARMEGGEIGSLVAMLLDENLCTRVIFTKGEKNHPH